MSAQHTAGRLAVIHDTDIIGTENDPENGCVGTVDVAHVYLRTVPGRTEANARRLVACWNACEGISTETLEKEPHMKAWVASYLERTRQRDELRKVLDVWLAKTDWVQETSTARELGMHRADVLTKRLTDTTNALASAHCEYQVKLHELLAALNGLLAYFESGNGVATGRAIIKTDSLEVRAAYAAIAKAEGGEA